MSADVDELLLWTAECVVGAIVAIPQSVGPIPYAILVRVNRIFSFIILAVFVVVSIRLATVVLGAEEVLVIKEAVVIVVNKAFSALDCR